MPCVSELTFVCHSLLKDILNLQKKLASQFNFTQMKFHYGQPTSSIHFIFHSLLTSMVSYTNLPKLNLSSQHCNIVFVNAFGM
jgi:hypothetical protein